MANSFMGYLKGPHWARGGRMDAIAFGLFLAIVAIAFHPSYPFSVWQVAVDLPEAGDVERLPSKGTSFGASSVPRLSGELRSLSDRVAGKAAMLPMAAKTAEAARIDALVSYVSKRYLVASEATRHLVETSHRVGRQLSLDPVLILAVMAVESRFNPFAQSGAGAKGLMQVIPKYHLEKFAPLGGEGAALDPETNILVGALALREYLNRTGSLVGALQMYNGASWDETNAYANKVFAEQRRLQQQLAGLRRI